MLQSDWLNHNRSYKLMKRGCMSIDNEETVLPEGVPDLIGLLEWVARRIIDWFAVYQSWEAPFIVFYLVIQQNGLKKSARFARRLLKRERDIAFSKSPRARTYGDGNISFNCGRPNANRNVPTSETAHSQQPSHCFRLNFAVFPVLPFWSRSSTISG